jgi:DNA-binding transcriptional LysR family regulator
MSGADGSDEFKTVALDLDLRKLRSFVAVAERLHFGRAAEALYITQPALSRQIRQLERELGVLLFTRNSREVALTEAGEQLALKAPGLLAAGQAAVELARRASNRDRAITVGFMLGIEIDPALRASAERHPDTEILMRRVRWWNREEMLLEGGVDLAFVRLPIEMEGLQLQLLHTEPLQVALPASHPLAGLPVVSIADLADEPALRYADASPAFQAAWTIDPRPDGSHPRKGPVVRDMEEIIQYVKAGAGVMFLPTTITKDFPRPDVVYVPISDASPGQVAIAWRNDEASPRVLEFVDTAIAASVERHDVQTIGVAADGTPDRASSAAASLPV